MTEPHVFCGPEFVLAITRGGDGVSEGRSVDSAHNSASDSRDDMSHHNSCNNDSNSSSNSSNLINSSLLLQLQTAIYGVCTLRTRQYIPRRSHMSDRPHADTSETSYYAATAKASVSAAPSQVTFIKVKSPTELSSEEQASLQYSLKVLYQQQQHSSSTAAAALSTSDSSRAHVSYVLLLVTDSRVAAEVYMLALQHGSIALTHGCRLHNYYRATARAATLNLAELLKKRQALRERYNMDADMWSALQEQLTDNFMQSWDEQMTRLVDGSLVPGRVRLLTLAEEHARSVTKLLRYCEHAVQYVGILDDKEEASPFLIAMGLFYRLGLTRNDLIQYNFTRHPRRVVRALAMFIARYTAAPEELLPIFAPSLHDAIVISCSADGTATCSMQSLSLDLLRKDEVNEAWLPVMHKYWQCHVIEPAIAQQQQQPQQSETAELLSSAQESDQRVTAACTDASSVCAHATAAIASPPRTHASTASGRAAPTGPIGTGRGVASMFGFHSLHVLAQHVRAQERGLQPARMSSLLAHKRMVGASMGISHRSDFAQRYGDKGDDDADDSSEDEDGFLIHVDVQARRDDTQESVAAGSRGADGALLSGELPDMMRSSEVAGAAGSGASYRKHGHDERDVEVEATRPGMMAAASTAHKRTKAGEESSRNRRTESAHGMAMRSGQTLLLSLLGRTQPFDAKDEHYIEF